jgi:TetR/AcrR family transcriptional repressor of lmrAB and yxaGH operons
MASQTREKVVEAATLLLRQSGLSGAGINEIVNASGAPKGSIYHFFPGGKEQIVGEALELHTTRVVAFMEQALSGRKAAPERIKSLFAAYAKRLEEGRYQASCPSGAVCLDLDAEMELLRGRVESSFKRYVEAIARHVQLDSPAETRAFAAFVLTAIQGAWIRGRASRSSKPFIEAGKWLAALAAQAGAIGSGPT